jgi:hypothetical protein
MVSEEIGTQEVWNWQFCACVQMYGLIKKDVPQAWHEPATTYIIVTMKTESSSRSRNRWHLNRWHLNRWHFGLIVAPLACDALTQSRFLDDEENRKQKIRDLRHLTFQVSVIIKTLSRHIS